jgi:hypothetical protein
MFDFLAELGTAYRTNLERAISSAVKHVVEASARNNDQKLAFPALAAAVHVSDDSLVVSYAASFGAILDGVQRANTAPSEIVLVIWNAWSGTPEMSSILGGLTKALYRNVEEWSGRFRVIAKAVAIVAILVGMLYSIFTRARIARPSRSTIIKGVLKTVPAVAGYWYLTVTLNVLPLSTLPAFEIGSIAAAACAIGVLAHRWIFPSS